MYPAKGYLEQQSLQSKAFIYNFSEENIEPNIYYYESVLYTSTHPDKMTSLYDYTVPVCIRSLESLSHIINKAITHTKEEGQTTTLQDILDARLHPEMYGLAFQVQRVSDTSKNGISRISINNVENVAMEDNETTFDELQARITKTIDFLKAVKPEHLNGNEKLKIKPKMGPYEKEFVIEDYVLAYMLPNLYFHVSMAYAILRMKGVPVGKLDYIGPKLLE